MKESLITGMNYLGSSLSAKGMVTYRTFNPIINENNKTVFTEATIEEVEEAVALAQKAFNVYKSIEGKAKAEFLITIADNILGLGDALLEMFCLESGLTKERAAVERTRTVFQLKNFADLVADGSWIDATIETGNLARKPKPKPDLRKMSVPLGPVVVFGASNFPLAYSTAGGDTAAALAAGCPVIVKSHPMHAGTGEMVAKAVINAAKATAMPNGVFSNLNSSGIDVGVNLVKHSGVKAVGFTGSIKGGRALFDLAAKREEPIPVFAEMGSVNPIVLMPKAIENRQSEITDMLTVSMTQDTGQFCTNPGLLLSIKGDVLESFKSELANKLTKVAPTSMLHPNIKRSYELNSSKALSQKGVEVIERFDGDIPVNYARQVLVKVDGDVFLNNPILHQEVFGPYAIIVECCSVDQMETLIRRLEGQLTGTIIAEDDEVMKNAQLVDALKSRVGRLVFNGVPTGVEVCSAMFHGGPYPASTDSRFTAVGVDSIRRWVRPISYQNWPEKFLPEALKNGNPLSILRRVNGKLTKETIVS
ncbi:aldehyde dehydrogenase (NADP(+)) [Mangrovimonas aestuarii]|uniref:aldehyde dehydrogenase (NADP(+)) n=1 Tax=Mangrovimonas aestuarii TaxID=3018443 RepID=UPI002378597D|nr:aldehyde dehydrogenase (NADP(+)) [Mangrovimonas aestuarii]